MMPFEVEQMLTELNEKLREDIRDRIFHFMNGEVDRSFLKDLGTEDLRAFIKRYMYRRVKPNEKASRDITDAFVGDANKKSKMSVNEDVGQSSDPKPSMDEMKNFIAELRAQRDASEKFKGTAYMEGSDKQVSFTLACTNCGTSIIPTAADAENVTRILSSASPTAAADEDVPTGQMPTTITTDPAEEVCSPNVTNSP
ncbi:unnamed protein product [Microthlaspi erraticum]|uniref:Uncharacterized protein n=1 Tax=Microthlaspi erraticum TaxID=1685480 RepID=A0A6D2HL87_9BRAS|nr:unnamed protein product [Microthlaspi erraticum]